jgi:pimeloyl-ACP methyl ester carboxylesterase
MRNLFNALKIIAGKFNAIIITGLLRNSGAIAPVFGHPTELMYRLSPSLILTAALVSLTSSSIFQPAWAARAKKQSMHVYFFTGGFVDIFSHGTVRKIKRKTQANCAGLNVPFSLERHWFTHWRAVSKRVQALEPGSKVVLIGHSWGAQSAIKCSRDLNSKNVPVDLLVTIDTVPLLLAGHSNASSIPANVQTNYNFYQTSDMFLRTCHKNMREGTDNEDGIHNIRMLIGPTYSPHMTIDEKVEPIISGQIKLLLMDQLDRLKLPAQLDKQLVGEASSAMEQRTPQDRVLQKQQ